MVVSKILGGLGNQMFQYAVAHALAEKNETIFYLDVSGFDAYPLRRFELDFVFGITNILHRNPVIHSKHSNVLRKVLAGLSGRKTYTLYKEPDFAYHDDVFRAPLPVYLEGYWQSEKYFIDAEESLRKRFMFNSPLSEGNKAYARQIVASSSVSLHIRRGDYLTDAKTNTVHGLLPMEYYHRAVNYISERLPESHFFVFSDDIEWAKENLGFLSAVTFIDGIDDAPDWQEMCLMSYCSHNIVANSSFSWWGAWLNRNQQKLVVAPKKWFNDASIDTRDLIPSTWTRL